MVTGVVQLGAEGGVRFDKDDHFVGRFLELHVVGLLFTLSKFI